ncbi:integrase core domain protein [Glaesserella parasuis MN-H]|nr:integrase core domain protein [Glaesserella parasuis MN-H]
MLRILTDRGSEYCGKVENHDYELYLAMNDIEHTKTKVKHPQTNSICERFHKTILQEFYQVAFRKKIYTDLATLQADLDEWLMYYKTLSQILCKHPFQLNGDRLGDHQNQS